VRWVRVLAAIGLLAIGAAPGIALGHDAGPAAPQLPGALAVLAFEPVPWLASIVAIGGYLWLVRRIRTSHPRSPVPAWRTVAWISGVLVILVALVSALDAYADSLLTVHMVQHLLLAMVAPPLLAMGAPVTVILRAASPAIRRSWLLPVLHSRAIRLLASPVVAWTVFTAVMWLVHFSPLFEAALENETVHDLEHLVFLASGVLFWWPVVAADPIPRRMGFGLRFAYLVAQMPVNAAVGLAIYFAPSVLYAHYASAERGWGPSPLIDQQIAGLIMWGAGDVILLAAIAGLLAAWMQADQRRTRRADSRRGAPEPPNPQPG
jgi:cytochrome c oxidase assembly factor CtaG